MLGGIGAGKSHVARRIADLAPAATLDADALAREALDAAAADGRLTTALGPEALDGAGRADRKRIARRVFSDAAARSALEALVHPAVLAAIRERLAAHGRGAGPALLVLDVPLLLEARLDRLCDVVWYVDAPPHLRRARAAVRGVSAEDWRLREAAQIPCERKRLRADAVLRSDERLEGQLEGLLRDLGMGVRGRAPAPPGVERGSTKGGG